MDLYEHAVKSRDEIAQMFAFDRVNGRKVIDKLPDDWLKNPS